MKTIIHGHEYELENFENKEEFQTLCFIHKEQITPDSAKLTLVKDGTTNEEVLKVLIDRMYALQDKQSCRENSIVITKFEEALMWLEKRTADRKSRGVKGTNAK